MSRQRCVRGTRREGLAQGGEDRAVRAGVFCRSRGGRSNGPRPCGPGMPMGTSRRALPVSGPAVRKRRLGEQLVATIRLPLASGLEIMRSAFSRNERVLQRIAQFRRTDLSAGGPIYPGGGRAIFIKLPYSRARRQHSRMGSPDPHKRGELEVSPLSRLAAKRTSLDRARQSRRL